MTKVYYDNYQNDCDNIIVPKAVCSEPESDCCEPCRNNTSEECGVSECRNASRGHFPSVFGSDGFLPDFRIDDIILLGIILVMLHDGTDDKLLLVIIGVIFLLGFDS